jgi:hypothetical protein
MTRKRKEKEEWEKANPPKSVREATERYGYVGAAKWMVGMSQ